MLRFKAAALSACETLYFSKAATPYDSLLQSRSTYECKDGDRDDAGQRQTDCKIKNK